jgi:hypothetical protein
MTNLCPEESATEVSSQEFVSELMETGGDFFFASPVTWQELQQITNDLWPR